MKTISFVLGLVIIGAGLTPGPAPAAAERETWIAAGASPYYEAGDGPGKAPTVEVHSDLDALLRSTRRTDILAARDHIEAQPELIAPVTMMVLAIRLYDVGLRDDSVFWFYVSKYRGTTLRDVANWRSGPFGDGWIDAMGALIGQADPYINGYAFCDFANQQRINAKAVEWVATHPYRGLDQPALKERLKPGLLEENLRASVERIRDRVAAEAVEMNTPAKREWMRARRQAAEAESRFCWKS